MKSQQQLKQSVSCWHRNQLGSKYKTAWETCLNWSKTVGYYKVNRQLSIHPTSLNSFILFILLLFIYISSMSMNDLISHLFQQRTSRWPSCEFGLMHTLRPSLLRVSLLNRDRKHTLTDSPLILSPWCARSVSHSHDCDLVAAGTLWVHFQIPHLTSDSVLCRRTQTPARDERAMWLSHCANRI